MAKNKQCELRLLTLQKQKKKRKKEKKADVEKSSGINYRRFFLDSLKPSII
jgi:hypothetical protein